MEYTCKVGARTTANCRDHGCKEKVKSGNVIWGPLQKQLLESEYKSGQHAVYITTF